MIRMLSVAGARPKFTKITLLAAACRRHPDIEHHLAHTWPRYDVAMSDAFFDQLRIRRARLQPRDRLDRPAGPDRRNHGESFQPVSSSGLRRRMNPQEEVADGEP